MMGLKVIFIAIIAFSALEQKFVAGKAGFGGFGGFGGYAQNVALINNVRSKLTVSQMQAKFAAKTANTSMQNSIALAENKIELELTKCQNKLLVVAGQNPVCGNAYKNALALINTDAVKSCDQSPKLKEKCTGLSVVHVQISQLYLDCSMGTPADQKMCIDDMDKQITEKVDNSLNDILLSSANAPTEVAECTEAAANQAIASIKNADAAFDTCMGIAKSA